MDKKEFFRKELKVEKANGLQKLWYSLNEKLLMDAVSKYMQSELKLLDLHIVSNSETSVCEKPNCNRPKLDNSPLCAYHWDIANS